MSDFESAMSSKADVYQALPFKLICVGRCGRQSRAELRI
jgi:hypothetical protein